MGLRGEPSAAPRQSGWAAFLRLWFLLFFSYTLLRLLIDLVAAGYVDLRTVTLWHVLVLPFGQAVIIWLVTQRGRRR
jgi:hypothetical protein